ncbi:FHA domain-containing protein, partial [Microbacterium sp. 5K110]|uniref:FHA domain-containing protein n=3 Tax=unclassified Microbacterium TaxID=2609290 RepID=UPI0010FD8556
PSDWAPPAAADFPPRGDDAGEQRSGSEQPETSADVHDSVAEALAALRAPTTPVATPPLPEAPARGEDSESAGWNAAPLTPAFPARGGSVASDVPPEAEVPQPAPEPEVPLTRPAPAEVPVSAVPRRDDEGPGEEFPELSEAVSAVPDAPQAGAPRSARTSVSALYTQPEFPAEADDSDFDALDRTVVTRRRRIPWALVPPAGAPVDLTSDVVILGRRPAPDAAHPGAQLVAIVDDTRTVSKTHARLQLRGETWYVTDLDSTNGVLFATLMGTEVEAPPGEEIEAGERFFLGDAEVRLTRREP